jgi:CubicO group peptidase (beta-lactamase class C family)
MTKSLLYLLLFTLVFQTSVFCQTGTLTAKFEKYIRPYVETDNFSGRILVSKKGEILFNKAYGSANLEFDVPNDLNTVFHIASLSKPFTAAAILILEQKGLLTTNDFLAKYIPDYPSGNKITLHHLLSHTSGLPEINDLPEYANASVQQQTPETLVALFKNKPLEFQPGEKYQYSNSNYTLLAFIIEQVSKEKYGPFLEENIFKPLGMDHTSVRADMSTVIKTMASGYSPDGNFGLQKAPYLDWSSKTGSGSIVATAGDLEKWNRALFGTTILSEKSKQKMFTEYVDSGYGWYMQELYNRHYVFMNGRSPGFCAHIGRYPDDEVCVIVLSNISVYLPKQIGIDLAGILFNEAVELPTFSNAALPDADLRQLVGKYKFGDDFYRRNYTMEVTTRDGHLFGSNYGELIPAGPLQFVQRSYWLKISFTKDEKGKVTGMLFDKYRGEKLE